MKLALYKYAIIIICCLPQFQPCKVDLFDMLLRFMVQWKKSVLPYAVDLKVSQAFSWYAVDQISMAWHKTEVPPVH